MTNLLNPTIRLIETDPEVKSYIYQQLIDFEPFVTPDTVVAVVARDPRKLALQLETEGRPIEMSQLRKMHRIVIILKDGETTIQDEGLHEDVYEAIRLAKQNLMTKMVAIQDHIVTNSERVEQINHALQNTQLH